MSDSERMEVIKRIKRQKYTHECPECNKPTYCAMEAGKSANTCWCMGVEKNSIIESDSCYCKDCLVKEKNK